MKPSRRDFLGAAALAGAGLTLGLGRSLAAPRGRMAPTRSAAAARTVPSWPIFDQNEEGAILEVLNSGNWWRGNGAKVPEFEQAYSKLTGSKHCLATSAGTTALLTALGALDIGPGDEVILPVYTFVATFNVITAYYALPVFVDTDPETFQIDAGKVEAAVTDQTRLLLPVHIGGSPANMDEIGALGTRRGIPIIEDACQAWVAQWRGRGVGNVGLGGCFSFQASKNLTSGEGGAVVTNDDAFAEKCFNFHNQGRGQPGSARGANYRMTEFQGGLLLAQMARLEKQQQVREQNAEYLSKLLAEIPGISPARMYDGCTRNAYHLYMFRYDQAHFAGLPRARFLQALAEAGFRGSGGYSTLNTSAHVRSLATNRHYQKLYGSRTMAQWEERNQCPVNDRLTTEAVWFTQTVLLAERSHMDRIADAVRDIQKRAPELARA